MSRPSSRRGSEKESLLDHLLPPPTHPRAQRRAIAVATLSIFLLLAGWLALTDSKAGLDDAVVASTLPQSWITGEPVVMGDDLRMGKEGEPLLDDETAANAEEYGEEDSDDAVEEQSVSSLASYVWHKDLEWDVEAPGRLIVVGDVHGMVDELKRFLELLDYSEPGSNIHNDTLVFVGDLVAKHPDISKSLETVDYIRSLNAFAVRGNHDQDVINWRSLMDASTSFTAELIQKGQELEEAPEDVPQTMKHKWRDEHYKIAANMGKDSMNWMKERSLTLHIRSLHTYVVHAGLLPWTIPKNTKKGKHKGEFSTQDEADDILSNLDFGNYLGIVANTSLASSSADDSFVPIVPALPAKGSTPTLDDKLDPEIAILTVPLNRKPYTLLEMRSLKKNGKVTKSNKKGRPWAPIWNQVMAACHQTLKGNTGLANGNATVEETAVEKRKHKKRQAEEDEAETLSRPKECRPLSVVYGHAAARGLDLRPYSFGLDSAAVYGGSFSALVVEGSQSGLSTSRAKPSQKLESTDVSISGRAAKVYSMKTKKPKH